MEKILAFYKVLCYNTEHIKRGGYIMEREEINNMEKEYKESKKNLIGSIAGFALTGGLLAAVSFLPLPLIVKVPMTIVTFGLLAVNDCLRVDCLQKYNEMKKTREENLVEEDIEEEKDVEEQKTKKLSLFKKIKNKFSKNKEEELPLPVEEEIIDLDYEENVESQQPKKSIHKKIFSLFNKKNKEEELPLPQEDEIENDIEDIDLEPKKEKNIFKRIFESFKQAKKDGEASLDEEDELSSLKNKKAKHKAKKNKTEILPLPLEDEEDIQVEKPIINYSFTKNGPQIAEIDLSNIHTEPGLYIEPQYFGFENDPADVKHIIVNKNDEEVNNYVATEIENVTGMEAMYVDYNVEDEEKRVYMLTR